MYCNWRANAHSNTTFIRLDIMKAVCIDFMGGDAAVVRNAKVSTLGLSSLEAEVKEGFIGFLMREGHASPFESSVFQFYIECPIAIGTQILRHRIASYNVESGRYKVLEGKFYYPPDGRPLRQIGKTGEYKFLNDANLPRTVRESFTLVYDIAWNEYQSLLDAGVAKEVARFILPYGIYQSMYMTINARSLMNFLHLRTDSHAQWEIQQIAAQMETAFAEKMPVTYKHWVANGRKSI